VKRKYGVYSQTNNFDVYEGLEELKREAREEEEKDNGFAMEATIRVLFGVKRPQKEHPIRLLDKIIQVLKVEVVEVEEEEE